jgi:RNA polymerase-binding transcription factor DksA
MADDADFAADYQQRDIDLGIKRVLQGIAKPISTEPRDCEECSNEIPMKRILASSSPLCIECQRANELEAKQYKRVIL